MKWLQKVDHVTYVVRPDTIRKWAWLYIEKFGGKMVLRVDDTNPKSKSSMMLWCVDFGEFGIALVAGIDREEKSHVTAYVERHGDHRSSTSPFRCPTWAPFATRWWNSAICTCLDQYCSATTALGGSVRSSPKATMTLQIRRRWASPNLWNARLKRARHFLKYRSQARPEQASTNRHRTPWRPTNARRWSISPPCRRIGSPMSAETYRSDSSSAIA